MGVNIKTIKSSEWSLDIQNSGQVVEGLSAIKQSLKILFETKKGTDPLRYDFGSDHIEKIDLPINTSFPLIKKDLIDAANKYERRIENISVTYTINISQLILIIKYTIKDTILTDELKLSYGLRNT